MNNQKHNLTDRNQMVLELDTPVHPQKSVIKEPRTKSEGSKVISFQDAFMKRQQVLRKESYFEIAKMAQHLG